MVWCGISKQNIIDPYTFDQENVLGETYKRLMHYYTGSKLWDYMYNKTFHQADGPSHYTIPLRQNLNQYIQTRWSKKASSISRPYCPPDQTPYDYFL